jgi:hypothetical protein
LAVARMHADELEIDETLVRRLLAEQLGPVGRAGDMTRAGGRLVVDVFWKLQPGGG